MSFSTRSPMTTRSQALAFLMIACAATAQDIPKEIPASTPPVPAAAAEAAPAAEAASAAKAKKGFFGRLFGKEPPPEESKADLSDQTDKTDPSDKSDVSNKSDPSDKPAPAAPAAPADAPAPSDTPVPALTDREKLQALVNAHVAETLQKELEFKPQSPWRLGAGYAPILGMKADFTGTGNVPTTPNTAGQNREYLDGYVRVDSSGNAGGDTTFWGYGSGAQEVGGNIAFQSIAAGASGSGGSSITDSSVSAAAGFELYGFYDMGAATILGLKDKGATWGFRTGIQYANVDLNNNSSGSGTVSTFTDSFDLGGNAAPGAGFAGTFAGPNQLLGDVALTRTFGGTANVQISGNRSLNVHLAITQWGSYLEIPLCKKVDLTVEGGFLLALASGSYDYNNRVSVGNTGGQTVRGSNSRTRILPGAYAGLGLSYDITDRMSLLANVRYQFLRSYEITANGSTAELDFSSAYTLGLSALWKF
jgi:hypothetical protein